ncbi:MAG: hypothetical protein RMK34_08995 [Tepidimonas sp.]|uniref:hypothetical protein n=1 Tax=Tepidimonas sp. TaxID=2002775 RepID=UPI00298EF421|nr:hypothetical protein [Tepidimonas sp.]MDW8337090.1 hypothetical protein [Tepidimonas sp.]
MPLCNERKNGAGGRAAGVLAALLMACSPALDWREVALQAPLQAWLPCKPERAQRPVPLLGPGQAEVTLAMASCVADGHTWALGELALPSGVQPAAAARAWQLAAWATLGQAVPTAADLPPAWAEVPCQARGAAWQRCLRGPGHTPDGRRVLAELHWSAQGGWLVQAAVFSPPERPLPQGARESFFGALAWRGVGP